MREAHRQSFVSISTRLRSSNLNFHRDCSIAFDRENKQGTLKALIIDRHLQLTLHISGGVEALNTGEIMEGLPGTDDDDDETPEKCMN